MSSRINPANYGEGEYKLWERWWGPFKKGEFKELAEFRNLVVYAPELNNVFQLDAKIREYIKASREERDAMRAYYELQLDSKP